MEIKYELLPEHIRIGMRLYIEEGVQPGHFLTAVICNDLKESFARADDTNRMRMFDVVRFMYNVAPGACWGSAKKMNNWIKKKREGRGNAD